MRLRRLEPSLPGDSTGVQVLWNHVDAVQKAVLDEFVELKMIEYNDTSSLRSGLARVSADLFRASHKPLVKSLCLQLNYVDSEEILGDISSDVHLDPLELFRPSKNNPLRSRFETLFIEDDNESSSLRQLFFCNMVYNTGTDQGHMLRHTLQTVVDSLFVSNRTEEAAMLQEVVVAVEHLYSQIRLPRYPETLTHEIGWNTLRHAWADDDYWLSVEDLLFIGSFIGPQLKIYRQRIISDGSAVFEPLDRGSLPPLKDGERFERVLLSVSEESHCGQHFSKLLTATEWSSLQKAHDEKSDSASAESSQKNKNTLNKNINNQNTTN
jgi:hypothetical protein